MYFAGVDIGSAYVKAVILSDQEPLAYASVPLEQFDADRAAKEALRKAAEEIHISLESISSTYYTGAAEELKDPAEYRVGEAIAIARGAFETDPEAGTVLQMGNMHTLAIRCRNGKAMRIVREDSCASGTGLFLKLAADVLKVSVEELSRMAETADGCAEIQSTCAIFAETEVISLIHSGKSAEEIAKGIITALAGRVLPLTEDLHEGHPILLTGGVSKSKALQDRLKEISPVPVYLPEHPEMTGAHGAALIAKERAAKQV